MTRLSPDFWAQPFAHRGLHGGGLPENSLGAIRAAVEAGYGVEFDVQPSADGEAMVFHDYTLDRMTDVTGRIDARTAEELAAISLQGSDETIPTLTQVLEAIDGRVSVLLEIKDPTETYGETTGALECRVGEVIRAAGQEKTVAVMSFNPHCLGPLRKGFPELYRGIVSYDFNHPDEEHVAEKSRNDLANMTEFDTYDCDFVSYGLFSLTMPAVTTLRDRGVPVFCWTVRSQEQADIAAAYTDQITFEAYRP